MNLNAELSRDSFINFYDENKDYLVPIVAIVISIFLFIFIIIPQIVALPQKKGAFDQEVDKVNSLKQYQQVVEATDTVELDSNIEAVSAVLPPEKNFGAILNAILGAANLSASQVISYEFQTETLPGKEDLVQLPQLRFGVSILGGPSQAVSFINELYKTSPISEVDQIITDDDVTKVSILFYYKPFPPVGFEERTLSASLNAEEKNVLNEVSEWSRPIDAELFIDQIGSPSAQ